MDDSAILAELGTMLDTLGVQSNWLAAKFDMWIDARYSGRSPEQKDLRRRGHQLANQLRTKKPD